MINLYHLKYFCDACRTGSLSKSAEMNRVTHSAISQAIQSLEAELNCQLVQHSKRIFLLTKEGQKFFENSDIIFDSIQNTINLTKSDTTALSGTLRIGFSHSIGKHLMTKYLKSFIEENPHVNLQISIGNSRTLEALLASKEIELGFGIEDGSFAAYEKKTLLESHFVLIERKKIKNQHRNIIFIGDKGAEVRAIRNHFRKNKCTFHQIQSWTMVYELVMQGLGVGLVPKFIYESDRKNLSLVSPKVTLPSLKLCAFYRSNISLSRIANAFIETVQF